MELLGRPRDEACRLVALQYLDDAVEARGKLGQDPEALHDLRVALRRFRSTLRAWREVLDRPRQRQRKALRRIIDATSGAHDAEVLLGLFAEEQLTSGWLVDELARRKAEGYALVDKRVGLFDRLEPRLRRRLARVELDLIHPHKLAHALADRVDDHADDVEDDLFELRAPTQVEAAHAARISVKRLRYLIEPYKGDPAVDRLVKPCKALQDLLGDLHDTHLAMAEVVGAAKAKPPPIEARPQLLEVSVRLERRQERLFSHLLGEWLSDGKLVAQAHALAAELRRR
jgi:CHAD domain-containing protein